MEIGKPEEVPQIEIAPIQEPVPRTEPRQVPEEPEYVPPERVKDPDLIPA